MPRRPAPSRGELREHLLASRIAGKVATTRENNLQNFRKMANREEGYLFGLRPKGSWTFAEVLALMADRCGVSPEEAYADGVDTIDPDRTLDRLDAMRSRLAEAAQRSERVLLATGHPAGLLAVHLEVAAALSAAGATVLTPGEGQSYPGRHGQRHEIRYLGGVAVITAGAGLGHTHSAKPIGLLLADLAATGQAPPDLVVADHGWAGGAGQAGVPAVGFADSNDPALFVGEAEGTVEVSVPLDDNVLPTKYAPLSAYLVDGWG